MGNFECLRNFLQLAVAFRAAPVDGSADGHRAHIPGGLDGAEHGLVIPVGETEEFVVVYFDNERDTVRIFSAHDIQNAKGRGDSVAACFYGELDDILRVEIHGVGGEGGAPAVLDSLVDGEDGQIAGICQSSVTDQDLEASQYLVVPAGIHPDLFYMVRGGEGADRRFIN